MGQKGRGGQVKKGGKLPRTGSIAGKRLRLVLLLFVSVGKGPRIVGFSVNSRVVDG